MATRRRKRKRSNIFGDILKFICAIALVVIAVLMAVFVINFIRSDDGADISPISILQTTAEQESTEDAGALKEGFNTLENGTTVYVIDGQGTFYKAGWLELNGNLYYFNGDGSMQKDVLTEGGMVFTFADDGSVSGIKYNPNYKDSTSADYADYYSLVRSPKVWTFLNKDKQKGHFYALMYKKTTDSVSHQLGGSTNPQYTGPYSMQIDGDYIYFLVYTSDPDVSEKDNNGTLYRMQIGADLRQIAAENVDGYKIINGNVYYASSGRMYHTSSFTDDENVRVFAEGDNYKVDISTGGKAYLVTEDGYPVTLESEAFKAGNFTYKLSAEGEILKTAEKPTVSYGGYIYSFESDEVFGLKMSRLLRTDSSGNSEVLSSEFSGTVRNMHYDNGTMYAEYTDDKDADHIITISFDGDIDYLTETADGRVTLIGIQSGKAVVMSVSDSGTVYKELDLKETFPLAVGVAPMPVEVTNNGTAPDGSSTDTAAGGTTTTDTAPGASRLPSAVVSNAPGESSDTQTAQTQTQAAQSQTQAQTEGTVVQNAAPGQSASSADAQSYNVAGRDGAAGTVVSQGPGYDEVALTGPGG